MTSSTPPQAPQSTTNPQRRRVIPAIPLRYPRAGSQKQSAAKAGTQADPIHASSGKQDLVGNDGQRGQIDVPQEPMTPESLSSSFHRTREDAAERDAQQSQTSDGEVLPEVVHQQSSETSQENEGNGREVSVSETIREAEGSFASAESLAANERPTGIPGMPVWTKPGRGHGTRATNGVKHSNGYQRGNAHTNGQGGNVKQSQKAFKALRIPQELPPEFYPSEFSPHPGSGGPGYIDMPPINYNPSHRPVHVDQSTSHAMAHKRRGQNLSFNPEANFQPFDRRGLNLSRTPSHGSSAGQPVNGFELQSPIVPRTPTNFYDPKVSSSFELQNHMLGQFEQGLYTDTAIDISVLTDVPGRQKINAHLVVLARSPTFRSLAAKADLTDRIFVVEAANKFMTEFGFLSAIRYLYGAPLLSINEFLHELSQIGTSDLQTNGPNVRVMTDVLGYIASGVYLSLPPVIAAGLELARHVQRWDTVPTALTFALDGGLPAAWTVSQGNDEPVPSSTFGTAGSQLLFDTLHFMSTSFPSHFQFAPAAAQLEQLPRLPTVIEARPSMANPRLSLIQFGSMSNEDAGRPDFMTTLLSSVLLSLPFAALKFFLEHNAFNPQAINRHELAQAVVHEREIRRSKVLQAKRVKESRDKPVWEATRWTECVADDEHVFPGFHIYRVLAEQEQHAQG